MKITGLNKAEVLIALYNRAKTIKLGKIIHDPNYVMTIEEAEKLLNESSSFDYLNGKLLKITIKRDSDELDTFLYNRDNGENAAEEALQPLINKYKEKCTVKSLKSLCAQIVTENKNSLFSKLCTIPSDFCNEFPALEVDPIKSFKRKVRQLLDKVQFTPNSQEADYIKKLYKAIETNNPYNSIHPIIKEIKQKYDKAFLSSFAGKMQPIATQIIKYMNEYRAEKDEYNKKLEVNKNKVINQRV